MLARDSRGGIDEPRRQQHDAEALALELHSVLHRSDEPPSLRDAVYGHVADARGACEPEVSGGRTEHDDLLRGAGAEEGEEGGDAVYHAEGVDSVLRRMRIGQRKLRKRGVWDVRR